MTDPWPRRTERLLLRRVTEDDLDTMVAYRSRPEVAMWLLKTEFDSDAYRAAWMSTLESPTDFSVVAELDGQVIGTGSLDIKDAMGQDQAPPTRGVEGDVGYILDPDHAGRGYATEILHGLLAVAFEELGLRRVTAGCYADNIASWRVMEKVGMRREQHGVEDSWHAELGWIDGYTYAMLASEWHPQTT